MEMKIKCKKPNLEVYKNFITASKTLNIKGNNGYIQNTIAQCFNKKDNSFIFKIWNKDQIDKNEILTFLKMHQIEFIKTV